MAYLSKKCPHSLSADSDGSHQTSASSYSVMMSCSVESSKRAEIVFGLLESFDGDYSFRYIGHNDPCLVTMCVALCFALAGHPVQIPNAASSIPRRSECWMCSVVQNDLRRTHTHWVSLQIRRDLVNSGNWTAFQCIHHCPSLQHVDFIHMLCTIFG